MSWTNLQQLSVRPDNHSSFMVMVIIQERLIINTLDIDVMAGVLHDDY